MYINYQVSRSFVDVDGKERNIGDIVTYPNYYGAKLADAGYLIKTTRDTPTDEERVRFLESVVPTFEPRSKFTHEGGYAVLLINKTGAASVKGTVVRVDGSMNGAVSKIVVNIPDPVGVIYDDGVSDGDEVWVVVSGVADVLYIGNTTRGHLARGFITGDAGYISGYGLNEAVPTSPFATDKHFYEFGHLVESRSGAGLARTIIHFN